MKAQELQALSAKVILQLMEGGATPSEGMVVLAMTLALMFRDEGVTQHQATSRFLIILKQVYGEKK